MKHQYSRLLSVTILAGFLAACGEQKAPQAAGDSKPMTEESPKASAEPADSMAGMSMSKDSAEQQHNAMGTITAVDAAAGTVTIAHEAVASAGWPAMTMTFKLADPKQAADLHANEKVKFTFTAGDKGDSTVTSIAPAGEGM